MKVKLYDDKSVENAALVLVRLAAAIEANLGTKEMLAAITAALVTVARSRHYNREQILGVVGALWDDSVAKLPVIPGEGSLQ